MVEEWWQRRNFHEVTYIECSQGVALHFVCKWRNVFPGSMNVKGFVNWKKERKKER